MKNKNLSLVLTELHKAFNQLNDKFYGGALPQVIITVQPRGKNKSLGWFTPSKLWTDGTSAKHEINISAETLDREYMELMRTLHHEMIHLYCYVNDIKDTSRNGSYHNKRFKEVSEQHGFYYEEDSYNNSIGWSCSTLTDKTKEIINNFEVNKNVFTVARINFDDLEVEQEKKKSNIIKWTCDCGNIIRTSKPGLRIACLDCNSEFKMEE